MAPSLAVFAPPATMATRDEVPQHILGVPVAGAVTNVILSLASITVLTFFLTQRCLPIKTWSKLPYSVWLVFAIYFDSYLFVFTTGILELAFGVNTSLGLCQGGILLCLVCYVSTKMLIYLFLVEKVYIIRGDTKRRLRSPLYIFNAFGMMGVYLIVGILNFVYRIFRLQDGECFIGMKGIAIIPLISFDAVVNVYLTVLFLIPLWKMSSFKNRQSSPTNTRLRTAAIRTFAGSVCTLISSIVNLTVLMSLNGEPGWVCLICCNCDIIFSSVVVQWVTNKDNAASMNSMSRHDGTVNEDRFGGGPHDDTKTGFELENAVGHSITSTAGSQRHLSVVHGRARSGSQSTCGDEFASDSAADGEDRQIQRVGSGEDTVGPLRHPPHAVIVTTTIRRESKPSSPEHAEASLGFAASSAASAITPIPTGPDRLGSLGPGSDAFLSQTSRTRITAGNHVHIA